MARRLLALCLTLLLLMTVPCRAQVIGDFCEVKGQDEIALHGFGLVVGLKGTGDGDKPATRALAATMMNMGSAVPRTDVGDFDLSELKNAKNVALVFVTATVPPSGARAGGLLHCTVSAVSAKSLAGGTLLITPLLGPYPGDKRTYAMASGPITIEDTTITTVGKVHMGCQLQQDFRGEFTRNGLITLVIKENHSGFTMAQIIQNAVNSYFDYGKNQNDDPQRLPTNRPQGMTATAVDAKTILVRIPPEDEQNPVNFLSELLNLQIEIRDIRGTRVFVSERSQIILVGEDVTIRRVAVAHKNFTIEAGGQKPPVLSEITQSQGSSDPTFSLSSLVNALNALQVETPDLIEIIKALDREGALLGELVID